MLANSKLMLEKAKNNNYAVPHTNICDLHTARALITTCEKLKRPVIIGLAEGHFSYLSIEEAADLVKFYAAKTEIPVVLHLDHGQSLDTVKKAIAYGFTSVMVDGSSLPFEKNVELTSAAVEYAHTYGITVEAELGHVGWGLDYESKNKELKDLFTKPEEAVEFVRKTGVDSLAVAIGTAHGEYKGTPEIDYDRLKEIKKVVDIPLVLHGSSGTGLDKIGRCVELGINKVNIFTDLAKAASVYIAENVSKVRYEDLTLNAEAAIAECLKAYFEVLKTRL